MDTGGQQFRGEMDFEFALPLIQNALISNWRNGAIKFPVVVGKEPIEL
jgi:hypothetical protein